MGIAYRKYSALVNSRRLAYALKYKPESIGLTLSKKRWAPLDVVLRELQLTMEDLLEVIEKNNNRKFTLNEEKTQIRVTYGHTPEIRLGYKSKKPPPYLYHGTALRFQTSIEKLGLVKGQRLHVHLYRDMETAKEVGKRHKAFLVFKVSARKMYDENHKFFRTDSGVWLTKHVPYRYLEVVYKEHNASVAQW